MNIKNLTIYQGKNGKIYLAIGDTSTVFTRKQMQDLNLPLHELPDFDAAAFNRAYLVTYIANPE
jgi:hypothetical protein